MSRMKDFDIRIRQGGDDAIAAVGELMPRWIPVSERMPEEGERVLFYNGNCKEAYARKPHIGVCIDDGPTGTKELRIVDLLLRQVTPNRDKTWPDVEATHWMPLPEPPSQ